MDANSNDKCGSFSGWTPTVMRAHSRHPWGYLPPYDGGAQGVAPLVQLMPGPGRPQLSRAGPTGAYAEAAARRDQRTVQQRVQAGVR